VAEAMQPAVSAALPGAPPLQAVTGQAGYFLRVVTAVARGES
jgi:hypothetical protein